MEGDELPPEWREKPGRKAANERDSAKRGEPAIYTELSPTKADQTDKEEHVQDLRKVEEIVEPVKRRKPFRHGGKLGGHDVDKHIDQ